MGWEFLKSSNNSWNFFWHNVLSSHVLLLEIVVGGTEIYAGQKFMGWEFLKTSNNSWNFFSHNLLSRHVLLLSIAGQKFIVCEFLKSSNNSWDFFSHNLLSSHVSLLEIAVFGTEIYRIAILENVEQFLEFLFAQPHIKSCFLVRNCCFRDRNLSDGDSWNSRITLGISSRTTSHQIMFSC